MTTKVVQRIVAGVLCVAVSGCSFGMKSVDPKWDGTVEPACDDDQTPVILDGLGAGTFLAVGVIAGDISANASDRGETNTGADVVAIGGFVLALGYAISGLVGESTYKNCREAKAQWRVGGAIGRASRANTGKPDEKAGRPNPSQNIPAPVVQPRGFYCSSSPANTTVGFCDREKAECSRSRDVSLGALPDLTACALVEAAWCTGDFCFPTEEACDARRARAGIDLACKETK